MRFTILVGVMRLMVFFPPVRYSPGGSMETRGYHLNLATLSAELIVTAMTVGFFLTFRNRR